MNSNKRTALMAVFAGLTGLFLCSCGAGPYGFSRYYTPTKEEEPFDAQGREYSLGSVAAAPEKFEGQLVAWFGIVESMKQTQDGKWLVRMSHNKHRQRHLCKSEASSSCRVTVHFNSNGGFSALLNLEAKDLVAGIDKIQVGTLMRVFGRVRCKQDEKEERKVKCDFDEKGGLLLDGASYRQWPARYYVTTRWAPSMMR